MKKTLSFLLCLSLVLGLLAACGSTSRSAPETSTPAPAAEASAPEDAPVEPAPADSQATPAEEASAAMPIADHDVTLRLWTELAPFLDGTSYEDPNQFPFYQNLSAATGVDFDFTVVSIMAAEEQFNLSVASQSFPDIICQPGYYTGSVDDAIENDVFLDVTDLLPEYAPDYFAVINRDDNTRRDTYSQDGRVAVFWEIAKEPYPANSGLVIRQDWLDKVGMDAPTTYDELHDVLLAFKEQLDAESPIYINGDAMMLELTSGYNFQNDFMDMDGTAVFGASAENFKPYLEMMSQWYQEGLIHHDFYVYADNQVESDNERTRLVNSNQVGVWYNWCEDLQLYDVDDPDYCLTAITNPVVQAGDAVHLCSGIDPMVSSSGGWAISTNCSDETVPIAMQVINYMYTEEGSMLANWGIEGETYTIQEDGTPRYTDLILNNPDFATNMCIGIYCVFRGPILSDLSRFNQNVVGTLAEYVAVWGTQDNDYDMPTVTMNAEDSERYNSIRSDIDTALEENIPKFVIGDRPIDQLDSFLAELAAMGMSEMVELEQKALDDYYAK